MKHATSGEISLCKETEICFDNPLEGFIICSDLLVTGEKGGKFVQKVEQKKDQCLPKNGSKMQSKGATHPQTELEY